MAYLPQSLYAVSKMMLMSHYKKYNLNTEIQNQPFLQRLGNNDGFYNTVLPGTFKQEMNSSLPHRSPVFVWGVHIPVPPPLPCPSSPHTDTLTTQWHHPIADSPTVRIATAQRCHLWLLRLCLYLWRIWSDPCIHIHFLHNIFFFFWQVSVILLTVSTHREFFCFLWS